jgi:glucose-1-phosphate cytidylyltransferase
MLPIGDKPILWHIMKLYAQHGHSDFILCLGYKGHMIRDWFRDIRWHMADVTVSTRTGQITFHGDVEVPDWRVTLVDTGEETMTGGRIRRIERHLGDAEEFLLTYGDGVGNIDIHASIDFHRQSGRVLTVTGVRPPGRFGELVVADGLVTNFLEKPQVTEGRVNGGFFVASRSLFRYLSDDPMLVFEREPLDALSRERQLSCFAHDGFWQPMDTFQEFQMLNRLWHEGRAAWKTW